MSCICRWHHRCQHPTNHRHYPMFSKFGCLKKYSFKHKSLSFGQNTLSNHSKLYQCLAFVSVTIDATTQRIIGTTLWFVSLQDWISICIFSKALTFCQNHTFQSFQVVPMACICQFHHRCNHPENHWYYPMVCEFARLNIFSEICQKPLHFVQHTSSRHSPPSPPSPPPKCVLNGWCVSLFCVL